MRVLYLCYLSLDDPLVWTQAIAYLEGLAGRGHTITLVTWEPRRMTAAEKALHREELARRGIAWRSLRYHKRPSLPATIYDVMGGVLFCLRLVRREQIEAVHARSHVPAAMALALKRLTGAELIFDLRGLMAEEYVDRGAWTEGDLAYRITKAVERAAIHRAAGIVVLTDRVRRDLFGDRSDARVHVIPCCADLRQIEAQNDRREQVRRALGLQDRVVMLYLGKFSGWYLEREMAEFFAAAADALPGLHFLVITQSDLALIERELVRLGVEEGSYTLASVSPGEVGAYLAAADFGISFIAASPSKRSSSPTKIGEYLGAGLPVVSSAGIGDVDGLVRGHGVGVVVEELTASGYAEAVVRLRELLAEPSETAARCRTAARERLSLEAVGIPAYAELYELVAAGRGSAARARGRAGRS